MKNMLVISVALGFLLSGCGFDRKRPVKERLEVLEERITELESRKPEMSSSMNQIQIHHAKLYFALQHENHELMKYLVHELEEGFEYVVENHGMHDGVDISGLTQNTAIPALKELENSLNDLDTGKLSQDFEFLTVSCNKCHIASGHPFIKIKNPEGNTYLNQTFDNH